MSAADNDTSDDQVPAWARRTAGESRWAATAAIIGILIVQFYLPQQYIAGPRWLVPGIGLLLLVMMVAASPVRLDREEIWLRRFSLLLMAVLGFALVWSVYHLVVGLVDGQVSNNAAGLLSSGGAIWLSNVLVFALWYWEFDRGGPAARAHARKPYPDFLWVQMQNPGLTDPEWEPEFPDYLYLSFTNATAFSPTDVMPMSRWAKTLMMVQSAVSLITVSLVIARAVNVLK
ncbi:DUF1345 domain-containing protein [Nocardia seriolae]|uniref:Uncharacterized protein n=1 Tax=Nocardia seriolae TaxID=37332 RepID=A0A0B8NCQ4_9NOCA|nr:DUF1345 domain-containing protein [Nocardia seriolae]APA98932.1 hypothetical protein NS506_04886 [Nocardia seriolae]MTJ63987.1 DUF1345 domain-containing protein [Nocardia seriolae]MTJ71345.1 DUF1345 domain-containing protein [Nocardia seriolae]MTJ88548.1 DUF1345 domain-containing protein [Nocardia seriolae]MTK32532.1 DUF1345 domain-containing protein [Nocardia seriolae]